MDITICVNKECPCRMQCYRFTGPITGGRQSITCFTSNKDGPCTNFIMDDEPELRKEKNNAKN